MARTPDELLAMQVGGASVAENLRRAVEAGGIVESADGSFELPPHHKSANWATVAHGPPLGCDFLMRFAFRHAYGSGAVPNGCSLCFKVKVSLRTVRELVAAWGLGKRIVCHSKWGVDLENRFSQDVYAGYFYVSGLDAARALFKVVREALDTDPKLGSDVAITIKRGCSEYEAALGPSDKYQFTPEMAELETYLRSRFRSTKAVGTPPVPLAHWLETAFRIGDDTYLDFTGGRRLRAKMVTYQP